MKAIKYKHLRLEDRVAIETYLNYGISVSKIALRIKKDRTTISKEIKRWKYHIGSGKEMCPKLNKAPYVCNGCKKRDRKKGKKRDRKKTEKRHILPYLELAT